MAPSIEELRLESFKLRVDRHIKQAVMLKQEATSAPGAGPLPGVDNVPVRNLAPLISNPIKLSPKTSRRLDYLHDENRAV
ncbi:hypothetical protein OAD67_03015 [bacterium]|nr:hypothetical protein [bacterium]